MMRFQERNKFPKPFFLLSRHWYMTHIWVVYGVLIECHLGINHVGRTKKMIKRPKEKIKGKGDIERGTRAGEETRLVKDE